MKKKLKYTKPKLKKEKLSLNHFFDSRYVDSLPSLFGSFDVLAQSGCGGGCTTNSHQCVCLLPNTQILMANQKQLLIQNVRPGMIVFDGTLTGAIVKAAYPHIRRDGYIEINNGLIKCTVDHLLWVENKQKFVKAAEITSQDYLINNIGSKISIFDIKHVEKKQIVYNIELELGKKIYFANNIKTCVSYFLNKHQEIGRYSTNQ